jgi:hypothetical protein
MGGVWEQTDRQTDRHYNHYNINNCFVLGAEAKAKKRFQTIVSKIT